MVSIIPSERSSWDLIGKSIGQNLNQNLPEYYQRQRGMQAIDQLQKDLSSSNGDYNKMLTSLMRAYTQNPGLERSGLGAKMLEMIQQKKIQDIKQPGEETPSTIEPRSLPNFLEKSGQQPSNQTSQFFPTNLGPEGGPGNIQQPSTTGQVEPLRTPKGITLATKSYHKESNDNGVPITMQEAREVVLNEEQNKKDNNQQVNEETKSRVKDQITYGTLAESELKKAYPSASEETKKIFKKFGEDESKKGLSEAEIERSLVIKAKNLADTVTNVEKDLSAPRLQNRMYRAAQGEYKDLEKASADLRITLKPLLDMGLYDEARNLLQKKGYGKEEIDSIVNPLSEREKIVLNKVPVVPHKKHKVGEPTILLSEREKPNKENVKSGLMDLKQANPNFSLVLARKSFEDKGYDWRIFKDALNELESDGFKLEDDQQRNRGHLDTPPLSSLDTILHGLNIIGR